MGKKLSYKYVKGYIESEGYTLLSKKYKNSRIKLSIQCDKGHQYEATFHTFHQGSRCHACSSTKLSYSYVKEYIECFSYKLLSNEYKNTTSKLSIHCNKGHEYNVTFKNFKTRCRILESMEKR